MKLKWKCVTIQRDLLPATKFAPLKSEFFSSISNLIACTDLLKESLFSFCNDLSHKNNISFVHLICICIGYVVDPGTVFIQRWRETPWFIGTGPLGRSWMPQGTLCMQLCLVDGSSVLRCSRRSCFGIELSYYLGWSDTLCCLFGVFQILIHIQLSIQTL